MGAELRAARTALCLVLILASAASDQLLGIVVVFLIWLILELRLP